MPQKPVPALANTQLRLAVDLTGTGTEQRSAPLSLIDGAAKPAPSSPGKPGLPKAFDVRVLLEQVQLAQNVAFDFVTIGDSFVLESNGIRQGAGQLDAALITSRIAPVLNGIGLIPAINTTHTEPFHVSKLVATLDHVSLGHGGWEPTVSTTDQEAKLFGRGPALPAPQAWSQAQDVVDVVAQLWDSWEDDAEIRDEKSGRFIDRNKLHYVDFEGVHFSVKGPSITPRPPQGHPVTVISIPPGFEITDPAAGTTPAVLAQIIELAGRFAQVVRLNVTDLDQAVALRAALKRSAVAYGRASSDILVYVNVLTFAAADQLSAQIRRDFAAESYGPDFAKGTLVFAGTPREFAVLCRHWLIAGATDGVVIQPASLNSDLRVITEQAVPVLTASKLYTPAYRGQTLRDHLGLSKPQNRFASTPATGSSNTYAPPTAALATHS